MKFIDRTIKPFNYEVNIQNIVQVKKKEKLILYVIKSKLYTVELKYHTKTINNLSIACIIIVNTII